MANRHGGGFDPNQHQGYSGASSRHGGGFDPNKHPEQPQHGNKSRHGGDFDPNRYFGSSSEFQGLGAGGSGRTAVTSQNNAAVLYPVISRPAIRRKPVGNHIAESPPSPLHTSPITQGHPILAPDTYPRSRVSSVATGGHSTPTIPHPAVRNFQNYDDTQNPPTRGGFFPGEVTVTFGGSRQRDTFPPMGNFPDDIDLVHPTPNQGNDVSRVQAAQQEYIHHENSSQTLGGSENHSSLYAAYGDSHRVQARTWTSIGSSWLKRGKYMVLRTKDTQSQSQSAHQYNSKEETPMILKSRRGMFNLRNRLRRRKPYIFQLPGYTYDSTEIFRHRDFAGRIKEKPLEDRYLHPRDGRLRKLIVATTDDIFRDRSTSTWRRTPIGDASLLTVRISTWIMDFKHDQDSWRSWFWLLARSWVAIYILQFAFWIKLHIAFVEEQSRWQFDGKYPPVPFTFHGNAKIWSNHLENAKQKSPTARNTEVYRRLKPRSLCFLRNPEDRANLHGIRIRNVRDWEATHGKDENLSYVVVTYSCLQFSHSDSNALEDLHSIAERATRDAGAVAYWVAASNMPDENERENDVYRISDVLRGAQSMVIAVGDSLDTGDVPSTNDLLQEWGSRMWTFPEALLSPGRHILVYRRGTDLSNPKVISKNQFAGRVWSKDAAESRQLIDHYLGNLLLSRLELGVTALRCLYNRDTTEHLQGDHAYALMGLLRMRPQVDKTDSKFQAFARLSLANDSDKLLERYLCTLPISITQPWYDMKDAYNSALWDIDPHCQVSAICNPQRSDGETQTQSDRDCVILDGAHGASIRWKSFYRIKFTTGFSWKRWTAVQIMENNTLFFTTAMSFWGWATSLKVEAISYVDSHYRYLSTILKGIAVLFFFIYLYVWLGTPSLVKLTYGGKFKMVQPALFGFEGYLNVTTIERAIFGGSFNRMSWSTNGSPLSRSNTDTFNDRHGMDPTWDPDVMEKVRKARTAKPGEMRVFTLVDTYNMQVTLFEAVHPPTCIFLCANEGGMQRGIGCSYEWTTRTFYRETVLRMPTTTLNRMDRVPRFKIGIKRPEFPSHSIFKDSV